MSALRVTLSFRGLFAAFMLIVMKASADAPEWTKQNTYKKDGNILTLVCVGRGPSLDIARKSSIDSCKATAANEVNGNVTIKSIAIETQTDAIFHQEVSSGKTARNLLCDVQNEYFIEVEGSTEAFILCRFNLAKAQVTLEPEVSDRTPSDGIITNQKSLSEMHTQKDDEVKPSLIQGDSRHIILTVMPTKCESLIVLSWKMSRTVHCDSNPVTVLVNPATDREIIVRANGFKPRHVKLQDRKPSGYKEPTELEVLLEK